MRPGLLQVAMLLASLSPWQAGAAASQVIISPAPVPHDDPRPKVFLAGSIDMGRSGDWQAQVAQALQDDGVLVLNPRRADWNPAWQAEAGDPHFRQQVEWELAALEQADLVLMYFVPSSQSPITLLEFGLYARSGKLRVAAPEGYWRKGNLDITGDRYGVPRYDDLQALLAAVRTELKTGIATPKP